LVPWGVRSLYEAPAVEHEACPHTMSGESPYAMKYPAIIRLDCIRVPVAVVGEVLGCQSARDYIGKEVGVH